MKNVEDELRVISQGGEVQVTGEEHEELIIRPGSEAVLLVLPHRAGKICQRIESVH